MSLKLRIATVVAVIVLAGCAAAPPGTAPAPPGTPTATSPAATVAPAAPSPQEQLQVAQRILAEGVALYDRGEFNAAIDKLGKSPEIASAPADVQVTALKTLAFSYCVTKRQVQCRTQFEAAFKLDPAFDLAPGERGHPLWGPVFDRVRKAQPAAPKK